MAKKDQHIDIIPYEPRHQSAFKRLNEEWIRAYFKMEEADHQALDHPNEYILVPGGHILVALYKGEVMGVCALMKMKDTSFDFELAKMAVSPKSQGLGIGWKLGNAIIDKARSLGANSIYLESNTILGPAINLYRKLGFLETSGQPTPYSRCNIQMFLNL